MTRALLVTGGGGVGKTTLSAALAVRAARLGHRTLVVTVDPARRLADALGIEYLGSEPAPHPSEPNLWAAMLDASASWTAIARRHATPEAAGRLVDNPFFNAATNHFPASQSYAAAEEAATFLDARAWELVIIDTPPAAGGIEFFTAPRAMTELVGGRVLKWVTGASIPGRKLFFDRATKPALRLADQILGSGLLEEIAQFLMDLRTTYDGVAQRSRQIESHLKKATTLVVTTSDPTPIREAVKFFRDLPEVAARPTAVVFNRTLPEDWIDARPGRVAAVFAENLKRWGDESRRQRDLRTEFEARYRTPLSHIGWQPVAPTDLDSLESLVSEATGFDLDALLS
ncbi:MAG: AAA family ATPase [Acidimicrobiia bacterium]|nr:AAA family ATPase [Acidimicrobiia bacterium]MDH4307965.1 AAA family ATPase [Acidimicrobiia bacterium]